MLHHLSNHMFFPLTYIPLSEIMFKVKMVLFNNFIGFVVNFIRQWETWEVSAVGDMDYSYDKKAPGCKIFTMEYIVYMFLTNSPTDTHHLTNNPSN